MDLNIECNVSDKRVPSLDAESCGIQLGADRKMFACYSTDASFEISAQSLQERCVHCAFPPGGVSILALQIEWWMTQEKNKEKGKSKREVG